MIKSLRCVLKWIILKSHLVGGGSYETPANVIICGDNMIWIDNLIIEIGDKEISIRKASQNKSEW